MGHEWRSVNVPELVRWTAVPLCHGALDGKPGTLFTRRNDNDPCHDTVIDDSISMERWKNIKRYFKLNNNLTTTVRGMEGYDPCARYDFIYKCLIVNMNYLTKKADEDGTMTRQRGDSQALVRKPRIRFRTRRRTKEGKQRYCTTPICLWTGTKNYPSVGFST
jgi:hypothetical protein